MKYSLTEHIDGSNNYIFNLQNVIYLFHKRVKFFLNKHEEKISKRKEFHHIRGKFHYSLMF
jgi:hypothetical protein